MIYRLKNDDGSIVYPFVKEQLRSTFPNTSFPFPISDETAADFGCLPVQTIERPEHDPRTQRLVEGDPEELEDGTLQQVLTVRDATPEEVAAYDEANKPGPDWARFKLGLLPSPGAPDSSVVAINQAISVAFQVVPVAVLGLSSGLAKAENGDLAEFSGSWRAVLAVAPPPPEALAELVGLAELCYLPAEFVAAIAGQRVRARDSQGRFLPDDPATPDVDEAWI